MRIIHVATCGFPNPFSAGNHAQHGGKIQIAVRDRCRVSLKLFSCFFGRSTFNFGFYCQVCCGGNPCFRINTACMVDQMSFEDFPREACESWNEVGLVYTRNKYGRVCSPPGYALSGKNDGSFKNSLFRGISLCQ